MQIPGSCVCFQVPTSVSIASSYTYGSEKNWFALEKKLDYGNFTASSDWKKELLCQDSLSASRAFFIGYYKNKSTKNVELGHKPSKDNTVSWGSHYPKTHTQPGTSCRLYPDLLKVHSSGDDLDSTGSSVWALVLAIVAGHWRAKLAPVWPLNGNTPWLNTLRAEGTSRN